VGFFSKDAILLSAFEKNPMLVWHCIIHCIAYGFLYVPFIVCNIYGKFRGTPEQEHHLHESPSLNDCAVSFLAVLSIIGGFVGIPEVFATGGDKITEFLSPVIAKHEAMKFLILQNIC
jgi:NADH-quinone oxidoreductase subunit L